MFYNGKSNVFLDGMFTRGKHYPVRYEGSRASAFVTSDCGKKFVLKHGLDEVMQKMPTEESGMYQVPCFFSNKEAAKEFINFMCNSGEQSMWDCVAETPMADFQTVYNYENPAMAYINVPKEEG